MNQLPVDVDLSRKTERTKQIRYLLFTVFAINMGQMALAPILAPVAREMALPDWQLGAVISLSALMVVMISPRWGKLAALRGPRYVLVRSVSVAAVAMVAFVVVAAMGMRGHLQGNHLFAWILVTRGVVYGLASAAVFPTAQTYIASLTFDQEERVAGMAQLGAAQGSSLLAGAIIGGGLAQVSLLVSLGAIPVLILAGLFIVLVVLRPPANTEVPPQPQRVSPFDSRVWPYLFAGFALFTALGFIEVLTGFMLADRFGLASGTTGLAAGGLLLVAGIGMLTVQGAIVPRVVIRPNRLLQIGAFFTTIGCAALVPREGVALLVLGVLLVGIGLGFASPGYISGASLQLNQDEQGALAGLTGSTNALTSVIAPATSTAMYSFHHVLPVAVAAIGMLITLIFSLINPVISGTKRW